jgi:hypothetical protein
MKTTDLQQEFIKDESQDMVRLASEIIGCECSDTGMQGDRKKDDQEGTKYQMLPDPYKAKTIEDRNNLFAFEDYFNANFGKWKERPYFDTPAQAFFNLIKAWQIWNHHLPENIKAKYIEHMKEVHSA